MAGTLYTSYFAKLRQGIGIKISIARYNPTWCTWKYIDRWFWDLAPSESLLYAYKHTGLTWDQYTQQYDYEINGGIRPLGFLYIKTMLDNDQDVTVYCYEKPSDNCHRHLLGDMFKKLGYEVREIE